MGQNLILNMNDHGFVVSGETLFRKAKLVALGVGAEHFVGAFPPLL